MVGHTEMQSKRIVNSCLQIIVLYAKRPLENVERKVMSSIEERVIKVTTDVLEWGGEVKTESNLIHDLGADSLDMAELVLSLEEEFDIMIDDVQVEEIHTVEQIIVYIEDNING